MLKKTYGLNTYPKLVNKLHMETLFIGSHQTREVRKPKATGKTLQSGVWDVSGKSLEK